MRSHLPQHPRDARSDVNEAARQITSLNDEGAALARCPLRLVSSVLRNRSISHADHHAAESLRSAEHPLQERGDFLRV